MTAVKNGAVIESERQTYLRKSFSSWVEGIWQRMAGQSAFLAVLVWPFQQQKMPRPPFQKPQRPLWSGHLSWRRVAFSWGAPPLSRLPQPRRSSSAGLPCASSPEFNRVRHVVNFGYAAHLKNLDTCLFLACLGRGSRRCIILRLLDFLQDSLLRRRGLCRFFLGSLGRGRDGDGSWFLWL